MIKGCIIKINWHNPKRVRADDLVSNTQSFGFIIEEENMKKIFLFILLVGFIVGCAPTHPLPQPRRVVDPSTIQGAVHTEKWDIAALRYVYSGQGLNYTKANLEPVFLVFKNKDFAMPIVRKDEIRGIGKTGEFLPYTEDEALRLVFASESFKQTTRNALRSGSLGAFVGAGLGALFAVIGGDNALSGAAIGAGIGGMALGVSSVPEAERKLKVMIEQEIYDYAWKEDSIPANITRMGYIYLPGNQGIDRIRIAVRADGEIYSYELKLLDPPSAAK